MTSVDLTSGTLVSEDHDGHDKVDSTESYDGIGAGDATASKNFKQLDLVMDLSLLQS